MASQRKIQNKSGNKRKRLLVQAASASGLLLLLIGIASLAINSQHTYADVTSNEDVKGNLSGTVKNVIGGNAGSGNQTGVGANANVSSQAGSGNSTSGSIGANASTKVGGGEKSSSASYRDSYEQKKADDNNLQVVSTNRHLYKPGEQVKVEGEIASKLLNSLQLSQITVQLVGKDGTAIDSKTAQANSTGDYETSFTLPSDIKLGSYAAMSTLQVKADLLGTLSAEVQAQLKTAASFVVVSPNAFAIKAKSNDGQEKDYSIQIASNSTVSNVSLDVDKKTVTFSVAGQSGTHGVTQITIPKEMLSGNLQVLIDGTAASDGDVVMTDDSQASETLEMNYHHSTHEVTITGTNVVPEFPASSTMLLATGAIGSIMLVAFLARRGVREGSS